MSEDRLKTVREFELSYALAKQLPTAYSINSKFGELNLDEELAMAVQKAIEPILRRRLNGRTGRSKAEYLEQIQNDEEERKANDNHDAPQ